MSRNTFKHAVHELPSMTLRGLVRWCDHDYWPMPFADKAQGNLAVHRTLVLWHRKWMKVK